MSNPLNGTRPVFVKTVSVLTSVATMLSLSGAAYLAPLTAVAAVPSDYGLTEGNTISASGTNDPDVYIVNELGYKRLFLNPVIFGFYGHLGGFANVKSVTAAARDAFPTSGLFRNCETNAQQVWAVEVTAEDTGVFHKVVMSGDQAVAEDANFFKKVFCINNNEQNWYPKSSVDYTSLSQVPVYARVPGATPTPSYGALSVGLASSNPASGTIVDGQARYNLAEFTFTGGGTVTSVKLKRIGVSADASLTNVYLYDGTKRLTDSATVSSSEIFFNDAGGLFTVAGAKTISVMADVDGSSGETIGVQLIAWNGNTVSISGNLHNIATATLATVAAAALTAPADATNDGVDETGVAQEPANDVVVWNDTVTIGQRYVWLKSIQLRVVGSAGVDDVQNFRLMVDGVYRGSAIARRDAVSGYIVFDLTGAPVKLETGGRVIKVVADVIGGSSKDFHLSLRQKSDIWAVDSQYDAAVLATGTFPIGDVDNELEISAGTLTITKTTDSPSGDVVKDASGVVLARFELKAAGERMKIENLRISNHSATASVSFRNAALFANDGLGGGMVQVGSTTTLWDEDAPTASNSTSYAEVSLGSSLVVDPGKPRLLEIRADIFDASGTNDIVAENTFAAQIEVGSSNVQRLTTLDYVNGPTTAQGAKLGTSLTVKTGSLSAGKYTGYANQSVVDPKNNVKVGHFTITAASSEDVNVSSVDIMPQTVSGTSFDGGELDDSYVVIKNDLGATIYTSPVKAAMSESASSSFSTNFTLPKNKTYQVEVWANVESGITATDAVRLVFSATGTTAGSSTSSTSSVAVGQTITSQTGSLSKANGSLPAARLINGGSTVTGYQFTLTPTYDDFYLDEVYVDLSSTLASSTGAVSNLILKNGSTTLATTTVNSTTASASFTGLNLLMNQVDGTKTFTVDVVLAGVGVGANDTAGVVTVRLDGLKYRDSAGSITTENGYAPGTYGGNANNVVKGYPTFTNSALPTSALSSGTMTLFKTIVSATGGQIAWNDITFTVASSSGSLTIATSTYQLWENGVNINADSVENASDSYTGSNDIIEFTFATERVISAGSPVTLELKATVGGVTTAGQSFSVNIANPKGTTVTSDDSTVQRASGASFVWTDQSSAAHSTTTDDWFTDGLVKTLAETQTVTK
ncbi:MAG: hypothetical protein Q8P69_01530 [bacterium]|nr:hypothetical protein [bacterium]